MMISRKSLSMLLAGMEFWSLANPALLNLAVRKPQVLRVQAPLAGRPAAWEDRPRLWVAQRSHQAEVPRAQVQPVGQPPTVLRPYNGLGSTGTGTGTGKYRDGGSQWFPGLCRRQRSSVIRRWRSSAIRKFGNSNRHFRGITDMQQVPGSNGQQTGTPRRVQTSLRVGFNFPAPNSPAADSSPSNLLRLIVFGQQPRTDGYQCGHFSCGCGRHLRSNSLC